ncbi:porin [Enterobacter hormaechei]
MKKTAVALAVLAFGITSAHAAEVFNKDGNKIDLYGKVKAAHKWTGGEDADGTYARLGFKGETQITDKLTGLGQFEGEFNASKAEGSQDGVKTRLAYAGLDFDHVVSVDYGRNWGVAYDVGAYTDVLSEFGGDSYEGTDAFLTGRASGVATLRTSNAFGLADGVQFAAQYQGQDDTNADPAKQHGTGYGFSLGYDLADTGVSAIAAYSTNAITAKQKRSGWNGKNAEFWGTGLKYDANSVYLATIYGESHNLLKDADKAQHFEAAAAYVFDFGVRPNVAYVHARDNANRDVVEYVALGTDYYFNKNLVADVGYQINLADGGDNTLAAGLTYQF